MQSNLMQRSKKTSLGINFIFNFISQVLTLAIPLITTPYLARVLHESGNGQYSYSVSIITYFTLFANLGFDVYGQRQIAVNKANKERTSAIFWEIFISKLFFTLIAFIVLISICFTVGFGDYTQLILILSIQVIAVPFDIQFLFKGKENFAAIAIRTLLVRVIGLICIFTLVKTEDDLWIYTLCMSLSVFGSNFIMWLSIFKMICFVKIKELQLKRHIKPAVAIFLPTLAVTIYSVFDKTMIGLLANNPDYENGCYEQAYKLNSVILLLVTIISPVLLSRNSDEYKQNGIAGIKQNLIFASNYVMLIGFPLIVGTNVLSLNLCSWFLGEGYAEVPLLLGIMSIRYISSGFSEIFGNQLFVAIGKEKYFTMATVCAAAVNFIINLSLIPFYGAVGAAIATAICEIVVAIVLGILAVKKNYFSFKDVLPNSWKPIIGSIIMFLPIFYLNKYLGNSIISFIISVVVGGITYLLVELLLREKLVISIKNFSILKFKKWLNKSSKNNESDDLTKK